MTPRRPTATRTGWLPGLTVGLLSSLVAAQEPPIAPPSAQVRSSATAVMVDVVVRDRKGAPVTDLTAADFELLEDGVVQTIGAVTITPEATGAPAVTRATAAPGSAPTAAAPGGESPSLMALVFDRLSPEARAAAHRAARAWVDAERGPNDFTGVFVTDLSLHTVQPYTTNRADLRRAIDSAAALTTSVRSGGERMRGGSRGHIDPSTSPTAGAESPGRPVSHDWDVSDAEIEAATRPRVGPDGTPGGNNPGLLAELLLQRMTDRLEEGMKEFLRDEQGQAATASLLALVSSLGMLPGRKTVVLFAEELAVPDSVASRFQAVIDTANRANVSIYTVDTAGLRVHSRQAETLREIAALGRRGVGDAERDEKQAYTKDLERNEDVLKQDPAASLGLLARQTGGFLIDQTNDLAAGFRRIDADRRFHYLLTYTPANQVFVGEYRRLTVKVRRPNVEVRARSGYLASPMPGSIPVMRYEAGATAALATHPRPADIPIRARLLRFPHADRPGELALLVSLRQGDVGHLVNASQTRWRTDFTILTRFVDSRGEVIRKASQPYRLTGPANAVEQARAGGVLFYRQPVLPPGVYTFEYAVHDALTGRAGAGAETITIAPIAAADPAVSSLVIVEQVERTAEAERDTSNPLYSGDLLIYPSFGDPVSRAARGALSFFYTVNGASPSTVARLQIDASGRRVADLALVMPAPDAGGRIQHVAQFPLTDLRPGAYTLRVLVGRDAAATPVSREATFTLVP